MAIYQQLNNLVEKVKNLLKVKSDSIFNNVILAKYYVNCWIFTFEGTYLLDII